MTDLQIDQQIATFLAVCRTASLATVDAQGQPCNANIQYVSDDAWRLYWVSSSASAHSVNSEAKPQAAVTIYAHQDTPEMIHGLQMRGQVNMLNDEERELAHKLYAMKYPFITDPPYDKALQTQRFYRITPTWLRWIDNRQGFGWKVEKTLG